MLLFVETRFLGQTLLAYTHLHAHSASLGYHLQIHRSSNTRSSVLRLSTCLIPSSIRYVSSRPMQTGQNSHHQCTCLLQIEVPPRHGLLPAHFHRTAALSCISSSGKIPIRWSSVPAWLSSREGIGNYVQWNAPMTHETRLPSFRYTLTLKCWLTKALVLRVLSILIRVWLCHKNCALMCPSPCTYHFVSPFSRRVLIHDVLLTWLIR